MASRMCPAPKATGGPSATRDVMGCVRSSVSNSLAQPSSHRVPGAIALLIALPLQTAVRPPRSGLVTHLAHGRSHRRQGISDLADSRDCVPRPA